ncbi:MAG: hypothetical protein R8G66_26965 [Cytophagales bacterium]|nr:hypothetical protein [Cytophagales bacterium]
MAFGQIDEVVDEDIPHNKGVQNIFPAEGNVGIGIIDPKEKLEVNGVVRSKEMLVESNPWPDFVFEAEYVLTDLTDVEKYISQHGHLEHIPSAATVEKNGIAVGDMSAKLLQKIEELTLYLIEQDKQIKSLKEEVSSLKQSQMAPDN